MAEGKWGSFLYQNKARKITQNVDVEGQRLLTLKYKKKKKTESKHVRKKWSDY